MASRPRRAAAQRANKTITDMVDSDNHISSRTGRIMASRTSRRTEGKSAAASVSRGPPSSPSDSNHHVHFTVKLPASKLRQATSSQPTQSGRQATRESYSRSENVEGKRSRAQKKSYVVETSEDDDDDDDDEDAEGEDDDMMDDDDDDDDDEEDAEREIVVEDAMDLDAEGDEDDEGEEDAEGEDDDMDMSVIPPPAPIIKVSKPPKKGGTGKSRGGTKPATSKAMASRAKDSDDEELSELDSDADEIHDTVKVGGGGDDEDAEGEDEEIEAEHAEEEDLGSDEDGSQAETPDLSKMTKRQRARFEENDGDLMKLSDEVQAKKHFTAEELSMRRAEMARRRRNLSDKRNEEVKMETINKLLKKQPPKANRKAQMGMESTPDVDAQKPSPIFVRWVSNKNGSHVAVPGEIMAGPAGRVFRKAEA
ncbi:PAPA-1-like conserved region-domain-containing protein [Xylaria palmicola]|nr:PAPA-1-like conserved region-domain-containing protein [Xylaria palmicola]